MPSCYRASLFALAAFATAVGIAGCTAVAGGAAATGALMAEDRRTPSTYLMDEEIELKAASRLREQAIEGVHVNFTSFNRRLLLTGEVPTTSVKGRVADLARTLPNVREIANELVLGVPTSLTSRSNDGYTTAKVKTRFLDDNRFNALHVKVVTENDVVYLMGLVKHAEANAAAETASRVSGVRRVVKVFEYTD
ncbi:BON domain-containing protein [Parasulfuritortus cantonensis]|uniref:BON domain-containing protein n=1 Tax=Parasulfuritortus cantonensis TaxID=2528202 RepID=A0A4R1BFY1_9PROT|nr:BON domain-containing protein [Parasulfuritortus cantonensis]TCJ16080.1 BON domain-containing protein [Parasulfuritortus cantonensis]